MKKFTLLIFISLVAMPAFSQFIYKIKTDSLLVTNDSCTAELNLENSTRNIKGFLYNRGNGRTEFRSGIIKLPGDSLYVIGNDTLRISAALGKLIADNGLIKSNDTIKLGGDLNKNTIISKLDSGLSFQFANGSYQKIGIHRGYTGKIEQYGKGRFQVYSERSVSNSDYWNVSYTIDTLTKSYSVIGGEPGATKMIVGVFNSLTGYNPYPQLSGATNLRAVLSKTYGFFMDNYGVGPIFGVDTSGKLFLWKSPPTGLAVDSILVWDATSKIVKKISRGSVSDSISSSNAFIRNDLSFSSAQTGGVFINNYIKAYKTVSGDNVLDIQGIKSTSTVSTIARIQDNSVDGVLPYAVHPMLALKSPNMPAGHETSLYIGKEFSGHQMANIGYRYDNATAAGTGVFIQSYGANTKPFMFWFDSTFVIGYGLAKTTRYKFDVNGIARFKGAEQAGYVNSSQLTDTSFTPRKYVDSLFSGQTAANVNAWSLNGNAGTNPANNFLGTTDSTNLVFRTNNSEKMRLLANGNLLLGQTTDAGYKIDINGTLRAQSKVQVGSSLYMDENANGYNFLTSTRASALWLQSNGEIWLSPTSGSYTKVFDNLLVAHPSTPQQGLLLYSNKVNTRDFYNYHEGLVIGAESTNAMKIFGQTGNIVIQTNGTYTDAGYKLDVSGSARISTLPFLASRDTILTYDPVTKQVMATKIAASSGGTLTSITGGYGLNGGTITTTGTFSVDTLNISTKAWRQKGLDSLAATTWNLSGNAGTSPVTSFLGTANNISLRFRTNNTQKAILDSTGKFAIGYTIPLYTLDVNGDARINTLPFLASRDTVLTYDPVSRQVKATLPSAILSGLKAAVATNTINNASFTQEWQWNALGGASGLKLSSASTAAASNNQKLLEIALSGANATTNQSTYAGYLNNTHTGTGSVNYGIYAAASGGGTNYAGYFDGLIIINNALRFTGTAADNFLTPVGSNVPTKIAIALYDPGNFGQVLAMGVPAGAQTTSRAMTLLDARTSAHQPTLAVFSPNEVNLTGFSWEGSNTTSYIKTSSTGSANLAIRNNSTDIVFINSGTLNTGFGGNTSPTAKVHMAAGTTSANTAPLKFSSGTNMTTPESGAIEFDGTNYFATSGSTRYTLAKTLTATATLNFASTAIQNSSDLTITVTGAADGDAVSLGVPNAAVNARSSYSAWVSAANTVTVRFNNYSPAAIDPASGTFRVSITKY